MSKSGNQNFPFDWKALEHMLDEKIPSMLPSQMKQQDFSWIENYVQEVLQSTKSAVTPHVNSKQGSFNSEVFETHRSVISRIPLPENTDLNQIIIKVSANKLKITKLPDEEPKIISLPSLVSSHNSRAVFKDGILEIRMPKENQRRSEREIPIRFD